MIQGFLPPQGRSWELGVSSQSYGTVLGESYKFPTSFCEADFMLTWGAADLIGFEFLTKGTLWEIYVVHLWLLKCLHERNEGLGLPNLTSLRVITDIPILSLFCIWESFGFLIHMGTKDHFFASDNLTHFLLHNFLTDQVKLCISGGYQESL